MGELSMAQIVTMILASGVCTGGLTIAGVRVHILYITKNANRQEQWLDELEKRQIKTEAKAEAAHMRIDAMTSNWPAGHP